MHSTRTNARRAVMLAAAAAAAISIPCSHALAADDFWTGFLGNRFVIDANWADFSAPAPTDVAKFTLTTAFSSTVVLDANRTVANLLVLPQGSTPSYEFQQLNAATLTVTGQAAIDSNVGTAAVTTFNGFRLSSDTFLTRHNAFFEARGGARITANVANALDDSTINLLDCNFTAASMGVFGNGLVVAGNGCFADIGNLQISNPTSRMALNSGATVSLFGNGSVDAGTLTINSGATFAVLSGGTLTANGGFIQINRDMNNSSGGTIRAINHGRIVSTSFLDIGRTGPGRMTIDNGSITVGSGSSTFTDWGGAGGSATIVLTNAAQARYNTGLHIAAGGGTTSVVMDVFSVLTVDNGLQVGGSGAATLIIPSGFLTSNGTALFGNHATLTMGAQSTLNLLNNSTFSAGSRLNFSGVGFNIGSGKTLNVDGGVINNTSSGNTLSDGSTLSITNGGQMTNSNFFDIANGTSMGFLVVKGAGSQFSAGSVTDWGANLNNHANVTIDTQGIATYSGLRIGAGGGSAFVTLSNGGQLVANAGLSTGNVTQSQGVVLNISGGTLTTNNSAPFFRNGTTVNLSSGGLVFNTDATFAADSTLNWSGTGTVQIASGKTLAFTGGAASLTTAAVLPGGATLRVNNADAFTHGKFVSTQEFDIAAGTGSGTLIVDGGGTLYKTQGSFADNWGRSATDSATITISNNALVSPTKLNMGLLGGTVLTTVNSGGLLSTGLLTSGQPSPAASVTINLDGGAMSATDADLLNGTTLNLKNNGSVTFGHSATFEKGAIFNWSSGTMFTAPDSVLAFDRGAGSFTYTGAQTLSNQSTLHILNGGTVNSSAALNLATGTMLVSGTGSSFASSGAGGTDWGALPGDSATTTIDTSGVGTIGVLRISTGGGTTRLNLNSSGELFVSNSLTTGGNASSVASISINGGFLVSPIAADFRQGTTVNVTTGGLLLAGSTTFSTGSTLNFTSGFFHLSDASSLAFDGGSGSFNNNDFFVPDNATLRITNAGSLVTNASIFNDAGTLLVSGTGSRLNAGFAGFGEGSGAATVIFASQGVGTFNSGLRIGDSTGSITLNIQSGARLTVGSLAAGNGSGASGGVNINVNNANFTVNGLATLSNGATFNIQDSKPLVTNMLRMSGNARMNVLSGGVLALPHVGGLSMADTSQIDLVDNAMIVGSISTSRSTIEEFVRTGRNGGAWNGTPGITSSAAKNRIPKNTTLGVLSGAEFTSVGGSGTFSGEPYVATDTLIKYTWYGDTDFNGVVNFDDYSRTDAGFNQHRTGWLNGDFDYNGQVNFDDYSLIDLAFNSQNGTLARAMQFVTGDDRRTSDMTDPGLGMVLKHFQQFGDAYGQAFLAAVPEPTSPAILIALGGARLIRRRRS